MDIILHITNLQQWQAELDVMAQAVDSEGNKAYQEVIWDAEAEQGVFNVASVPTNGKGNQAYTLVRVDSQDTIDAMTHANRVGECVDNAYVFDSNGKETQYESHLSPFTYDVDDGEGGTTTATKPYMIGVFL